MDYALAKDAVRRALPDVSETELRVILWEATARDARGGTVLCKEGPPVDGILWVLVTGEVEIVQGKNRIATREGPALLGEASLVRTDGRRTATVAVTSPSAELLEWQSSPAALNSEDFTTLRAALSRSAWAQFVGE